jgi:cytochrome c oxidase assembly protein subunit 15
MTDWHLVTDTFPLTDDKVWKPLERIKKISWISENQYTPMIFNFLILILFNRNGIPICGSYGMTIYRLSYIFLKRKFFNNQKCTVLLGMSCFQRLRMVYEVRSSWSTVDVSHFRPQHLTFAFITFAYAFGWP